MAARDQLTWLVPVTADLLPICENNTAATLTTYMGLCLTATDARRDFITSNIRRTTRIKTEVSGQFTAALCNKTRS